MISYNRKSRHTHDLAAGLLARVRAGAIARAPSCAADRRRGPHGSGGAIVVERRTATDSPGAVSLIGSESILDIVT